MLCFIQIRKRRKTLILFDGNNLLYRILKVPDFFNISHNGLRTGGLYGVLQALHQTAQCTTNDQKIVLVWDNGRSQRRSTHYPEYKSNRNPLTSIDKEINQEFKTVFENNKYILNTQILPTIGIHSISLVQHEADDLIYKIIALNESNEEFIVVSEDMDYYQLLVYFDKVKIYHPMKKCMITRQNFKELFDFDYRAFLYYKSIIGDKSDNIKGVPGVGKVTATKVLNTIDLNDIDKSLFKVCKNIYDGEQLHTDLRSKKGIREGRIYSGWGIVARNLEIIDLRREYFSSKEEEDLKKQLNPILSLNKEDFIKYCNNYGISQITNNPDFWFNVFKDRIQ
jgi:5'-3' exonuclease